MEQMEQMEEQRAFYMWAKRRGGANPDRAGLNPKRQRTCTETTSSIWSKKPEAAELRR